MDSKWKEFESAEYAIQDIGREFFFHFPVHKLYQPLNWQMTIEEDLLSFLKTNFTSFTRTIIPSFGIWHDGRMFRFDQCHRYEISFLGKDRILMLLRKLSRLARLADEKCVYIGAGQYRALLFPAPSFQP